MTDEAAVVEAEGVVKRYGTTTVLDRLSISVGRGITGLLGANGAGKTTLLGLVLGLHGRDEGSMRVLGLDPAGAGPEIRARIGYSPEHHELPPDAQAAELVRHVAELHGLPRRAATERANDALWQVGLGEERFRPLGTMSTGQRQRVKLAQAIAHDPRFLLLDEPTDGLDPVQRDEMLRLIRRVGTEFGMDVLLSSHRLGEVEQICDAVTIISDGKVVQSGRVDHLRETDAALLVEVDDPDALQAALAARGLVVERARDTLRVEGGDVAVHVRDVVAEHGLALRRMAEARRSLEDVFMEAGQ
ncbi:MAG: ABC transporter ATP-binding protein [Actinomycetota bacterium]